MTDTESEFYFTQDEYSGRWICVEEYRNPLRSPEKLAEAETFSQCLQKAQLYLKRRNTRIPWDGVSDIEPPAS